MSLSKLTALEHDGYKFVVSGNRLRVRAREELLSPVAVEQLRRIKPELMNELQLRAFGQSVQNVAIFEFDCFLYNEEILDELDNTDAACLPELDRDERQAWAWMLAYRLTRERIHGHGSG